MEIIVVVVIAIIAIAIVATALSRDNNADAAACEQKLAEMEKDRNNYKQMWEQVKFNTVEKDSYDRLVTESSATIAALKVELELERQSKIKAVGDAVAAAQLAWQQKVNAIREVINAPLE